MKSTVEVRQLCQAFISVVQILHFRASALSPEAGCKSTLLPEDRSMLFSCYRRTHFPLAVPTKARTKASCFVWLGPPWSDRLFALLLGRHELQLYVEEGPGGFLRLSIFGSDLELLSAHGADLLGGVGMYSLMQALGTVHVA